MGAFISLCDKRHHKEEIKMFDIIGCVVDTKRLFFIY